jgi:hypothetical protein
VRGTRTPAVLAAPTLGSALEGCPKDHMALSYSSFEPLRLCRRSLTESIKSRTPVTFREPVNSVRCYVRLVSPASNYSAYESFFRYSEISPS